MRAQIRPIENSVEALTRPPVPFMDFDHRIFADHSNWQIREALIYSYHWGSANQTAEDFVRFKSDCRISDILSQTEESLYVKQTETKQFLGLVPYQVIFFI